MIGSPVKEVALTPTDEAASFVTVLARLADNPSVDVTKLERLIDAHERIVKSQAKADFDAAFSVMQGELPVIAERGAIEVRGTLRSKYALYEDIIEQVRPVLSRHGFSLRHRNEYDGPTQVIIGVLSHRSGHSEQDVFRCPPDGSGEKSSIQAMGSTRSYGQRYTTIALLGIATRGLDRDGVEEKPAEQKADPEGFDAYVASLESAAMQGTPALMAAFNKADQKFRAHLTGANGAKWGAMKKVAESVPKKAVKK